MLNYRRKSVNCLVCYRISSNFAIVFSNEFINSVAKITKTTDKQP